MDIQINTDHNINASEGLATHVTSVVENALDHVREHVTRVEAHLSDENDSKGGAYDKRCVLEASLEDHLPVAVTHHATNLQQSVEGAAHKLTRLLDDIFGRPLTLQTNDVAFAASGRPLVPPDADEALW